jgi:hypothetical protein
MDVQDEWRATPDLTLNAGIRYDLQFLETVQTDTNNVSPRVGFVWSVFESRRTVVRGNAGLFYDRVPLRAVANALLSAGNAADPANLRQIAVSLSPAQAGAPVFPNQDVSSRRTGGPGAYPSNPLPTFGVVTAVGESRTWQFATRVRF